MTRAELYSDIAEQSVLGGLLLNNEALDHVGELRPEHFFSPRNRQAYREVLRLIGEGAAADVLTVFDRLGAQSAELLIYLNALSRNTPGVANIGHYADMVRDRAQRRGVLALASELSDRAHTSIGEPISSLIDYGQGELEKLSASRGRIEPEHVADGLQSFLDEMKRQAAGVLPKAISTGFADLDRRLSGGMRRGELIVIAARPKMGKTAFAMSVVNYVATHGQALFLSMEMPKRQLLQRQIASLGRVDLRYLLQADTIPADDSGNAIWLAISTGLQRLRTLSLWIDDQGGLSLFDVRTKARSTKRRHGLDVLVIDYLQLMSGEGDNRNAQIEGITRGLKALAKELDIAIVLLSQLNRQLESRADKRPMPSDLRDSGAIEQDCDAALFLYRDEVYHADTLARGIAEINVGLIRQGEPGRVRLAYVGAQTRFSSLASTELPATPDVMPAPRKTRGFE
ncbi:replicative DNA helicase [Pigmentiphaga aceris]|uniref:DNA 5'-3' helicase n=1 Tax=Pigmentiphaga aceris TaxID=1940612 RepID=A0A5C0B1S9_9BURK|nr:replicative DNA helicase [Pigmentiphaga aceris]QEI07834.1 replicative DNA helicase [Pigmentiphaga aceris]